MSATAEFVDFLMAVRSFRECLKKFNAPLLVHCRLMFMCVLCMMYLNTYGVPLHCPTGLCRLFAIQFMTYFFLIFACVSIVCNSSTSRFIFLSDGSGLTGVFIALDLLLRQVLSKNSIDIRDVVLSLRNNRPQMVRTLVSKSIYWIRLNDKLCIHYFILKTYYKIQIIINDILAKLKSLAAWLMVN